MYVVCCVVLSESTILEWRTKSNKKRRLVLQNVADFIVPGTRRTRNDGEIAEKRLPLPELRFPGFKGYLVNMIQVGLNRGHRCSQPAHCFALSHPYAPHFIGEGVRHICDI